jgi:hypothetical protein
MLYDLHTLYSVKWNVKISRIWGSHGGEYEDRPDDGGSKDLWNFGKRLPDYTVLQPRRQQSSNVKIILNSEKGV